MPKSTASANIRAELARHDVSQSAVAELLGVSPGQVSARLRGRVPWRVHELQAIATHLGVPLSALVDDTHASTPAAS